jgi:hypothetical protein
MNSLLDGGEQLERELAPEPMMAPAAGSLVLHLALAACLLTYGLLAGLFHHNQWGNAGSGGAIQVSLTSALPLPSDQPPNENVLATDTPSQAPAEPTPKAKQAIDETAIPITGKQKKQQQESARKTAQHQPEPKQSGAVWRAGGVVYGAVDANAGLYQRPDHGQRWRLRQPLRMVRGQPQSQDGLQLVQAGG